MRKDFFVKTEEIKVLRKQLLLEQQTLVVINRLEYVELLHEVLVLRHKIRRKSSERRVKPDKTE